jgi:hypothetical protein
VPSRLQIPLASRARLGLSYNSSHEKDENARELVMVTRLLFGYFSHDRRRLVTGSRAFCGAWGPFRGFGANQRDQSHVTKHPPGGLCIYFINTGFLLLNYLKTWFAKNVTNRRDGGAILWRAGTIDFSMKVLFRKSGAQERCILNLHQLIFA